MILYPWDSLGKNTAVGCHFLCRGSTCPRDGTCISYVSCFGRVATRLAAAGSTFLGLAPRQAAARGVVADSVAVHRSTASWLTARLATAGPTEGLSTAARPTAGGLTAGGHTSRLAAGGPTAGGFTSLIASWGAGGLAAGFAATGGLAAGGHTSRSAAGGPATGGLTASWGAAGLAAAGLTAGGPAANGLTAGGLAARGAARVGHCVCDEDALLFRSEFLRFCSLLLFWGFYIVDHQCWDQEAGLSWLFFMLLL
ncbi:hypothetical protein FD754_023422 [Muntiacus muntjak]|uniref:Uncharacterized protein n=1 Tax=Muntiacus muntjak TaxID=9888 RepID=A0A5N3UTH5_MUNMU|nr:hypothetical protein FD754_023422 [Muntiacus muntjak]